MYIKRKIEACSSNHFWRGKVTYIANSERVASLSYPASKAHETYYVLYCHLCLVRLSYIFTHYLTNGTLGGGGLLNIKRVP
jgi:hypothetical protein